MTLDVASKLMLLQLLISYLPLSKCFYKTCDPAIHNLCIYMYMYIILVTSLKFILRHILVLSVT